MPVKTEAAPYIDAFRADPSEPSWLAEARRDSDQGSRAGGERLVDSLLERTRRHAQDHKLGRLG